MCFILLLIPIVLCKVGYDLFNLWGGAAALILSIFLMVGIFHLRKAYILHAARRPWQWFRAKMGWGFSVAELHRRLGLKDGELQSFEPKYKEASIPKKSGGRRRLLVPDEKTKALQRLILRRLLKKLRVHPAAHGFVKGRSAILNAAQHSGQAVVITMDVVDFFSSTTAKRIDAYFRRIGWNATAAALLTRLTTHENGLPQGAPTSPAISNLVNYYLDVQIAKAVEGMNFFVRSTKKPDTRARNQGTYTRYADDIAISYSFDYPRTILRVMDRVKRILKSKSYRIHSLKKRRVRRQHQQQVVTGLVVNAKPQLSRAQRRWLRAVKHHLKTGQPATLTEQQLQGWQSYQHSIEKIASAVPVREFQKEKNKAIITRRQKRQAKEPGSPRK